MKVELDVPYSKDYTKYRLLDLFLPEGNANGCGFLFIHGGGWGGGDRKGWHEVAKFFCERGYVCATAGYRLVPDWIFPSQVEDARLAMSFFRENADRFGFSPAKVAAAGSSAGGHLVAMLGTIDADDWLGRSPEMTVADTRPNVTVCYCPATTLHIERRNPLAITKSIFRLLGKSEEEAPELYRQASPIDRITGKESPFLFLHGDADEIIPVAHSTDMCAKLKEAGCKAEVVVYPGVGHGFGYGITTNVQKKSVKHIERFLEIILEA